MSVKGTFIVTGCNGGLGRALVSHFLGSPMEPCYTGQFGVRNPSTAKALQRVVDVAPHTRPHEIITLDLSTSSSIRAAAKAINEDVRSGKIPPIRALVLNAAMQTTSGQSFTTDGLESNFGVNYLANFLLVLLLLPSMDKEMGRVVIVSSWTHDINHPLNGFYKEESHKTIMTDPYDLARPKKADEKGDEYNAGMRRYGMSKFLMITWMYELQRRLSASKDHSNISVLAVDPGAMPDTSLIRDSPLALRILVNYVMVPLTPVINWLWPNGYFRTRGKSATDLFVASFDEKKLGKHPKAVYLNGSDFAESSAETKDEEKQHQLWKASVELCKLKEGETPLQA